jgi:hypothetical protein
MTIVQCVLAIDAWEFGRLAASTRVEVGALENVGERESTNQKKIQQMCGVLKLILVERSTEFLSWGQKQKNIALIRKT